MYSSGLSAVMNVIQLLKSGDHAVIIDDVYGGTGRIFREYQKTFRIEPEFVDITDIKLLEKALRPTTRVNSKFSTLKCYTFPHVSMGFCSVMFLSFSSSSYG